MISDQQTMTLNIHEHVATLTLNRLAYAVRYLKEGLRRSFHGDYEEMGTWVSQTLAVLFQTEDHREGVASFLEKREPKFSGR
jgi:enoyl-CoA hydratase/carnithine racemase